MEKSYAGAVLVLVMAALLLGVLVQDPRAKAKTCWIALGVYVVIGWVMSGQFGPGIMWGVFLCAALFIFPFQLGGRLGRLRGGKGDGSGGPAGGGGIGPQ